VKVFLDTNVLASAFGSRGLCTDVLEMVIAEHELMVAEVVLTELRRVLREKFRLPVEAIAAVDVFLRQYSIVPRPKKHLGIGIRDSSDEWVVASAKACTADVIVTGDRDLLEPGVPLSIRVLSPRAFWELAKARS
jgi:putative PIN family toxin of toxin-antitoxin system